MRSPARLTLLCLAVFAAAMAAVLPLVRSMDREPSPTPDDAAAREAVQALRDATNGTVQLDRDAVTGGVDSLSTEPGAPIDLEAQDPDAAGLEFADRFGDALGAPGTDLVPLSTTPSLGTGAAVRLQQQVSGVPVFGGQASVQLDDAGDVRSALSDLSATAADVGTDPTVAPAAARVTAMDDVAAERGLTTDDLTATRPERWIYDPVVLGAGGPPASRLVWRVDVDGADAHHVVLVDAQTGAVLLSMDQHAHALQRFVCNVAATEDKNCNGGPYAATEASPPAGNNEINRAFIFLGATYLFFHERFDRDSVDGNGLPLRATVNYCRTTECPYNNAFWNGVAGEEGIVLGAGFATDDIVGHELTHGVVQHTAGLFTQYQSGAINESMADVFGELVDLTDGIDLGPDVRWQIGEDRAAGVIRNMADPTAKNHPDRMSSPLYRADQLGMHANAGVGNRAAALLADGGTVGSTTVTPLGVDKVAAIWYETLTTQLTSASDYADLGVALPQACVNLVGTLSITLADCAQVETVVGIVEMGTDPPNAPAPEAPVCPDDIEPTDLFADDFEDPGSGNWTTSALGGWNWSYPPPASQRYATSGDLNLWGPDTGTPQTAVGSKSFGDARIAMSTAVNLPPNTQPYLRFRHAWYFHNTPTVNFDGGVLEYSTSGNTWIDAGPLFEDNGYNGTLNATTSTNPLNGRPAFVNESRGYISTRLDLSTLTNKNVRFRFRLGEDASDGDLGWYIDDLQIYLCPEPEVTVTQSSTRPTVTVGEDIDLQLTLVNTGNVPLTGVEVTDETVPDCEGPVPDIAVGATKVVTCTYATIDPDDIGLFTNVATVGADQLSGTTASNPVSIPVLAPGTPLVLLEQVADQTVIGDGEAVTLHLTVTNIGNVPLTGISILDPQAPDCAGPVDLPGDDTELAEGARVTVDCTHTPPGPGMWTNAASVTTTELPEPTPATSEVTVEVRDVTDPVVTITTPADGAVVNQGQVVAADFACTDDQPTPVLCIGTVKDAHPIDTATPGPHQFSVTATDGAGNDVTVVHDYVVAVRRPDNRIRQGAAGAQVGDDVVNSSAAGQNRTTSAARNRTVIFFVTVQNDGSHPEALRVRGQPSTTNYSVEYRTAGEDISAAVRTGSYQTPVLVPGATRTIKVIVTVGPNAPAGGQVDRLVTSTSTSDPKRKDVVRFIVRRA